jgi:hypothetical protein
VAITDDEVETLYGLSSWVDGDDDVDSDDDSSTP